MAYVIGSQKGKDIAKNMKTGETFKASDGSTWTKKSDGSVSVTTSKGETFHNAYTSPSGGSSGGGSSYSGGGGSSKNSQYSKPNLGSTWNADTDYQEIIENAVANGDYVTAAKAEQLRNQKITATGSNYETTNLYGGHLDGIDYGTVGQNQMAHGASWQDVLNTYNSRYSKAANTAGLQQYANDEIQQMMWQYIQDNMKQSNQQEAQNMFNQWQAEYEQNNPKQDYQSKYDPQIDALLNQILNRDDFSYDAMNDPLYQQYANMYRREGDRAMKETMAEAAAGAGGMNTYAITAAQQANSYYNSQLNDKIPELYQLAYDMYLNDKESKVQDLGILQNMDATQYNRYRDTINDYYADKNFAYGAYRDAVNQGQWQTNFDYNSMLTDRDFMYSDAWKNKEWNTNRADLEYDKTQYNRETAEEKLKYLMEMGVMPDENLIAQAGWTKSEAEQYVAEVKKNSLLKGRSGGSGGRRSGGGGGGDDDTTTTTTTKNTTQMSQITSGLDDLGLGYVYDPSVVAQLARAGGVYEGEDGKLHWAEGWNANNFQAKLANAKVTTQPWKVI